MKKLSLLMLVLFCSVIGFAQVKPIAEKINQAQFQKKKFETYSLFSVSSNTEKIQKYNKAVSEITVLDLNQNQLNKLIKNAPEFLTIEIPYANQTIEIDLYKETIMTNDFMVKNEKGKKIDYTPGRYYKGIIKGNESSLVAISFFDDEIVGVISSSNLGNINVGKSQDKVDYLSFSDRYILGQSQFSCGVDELEHNEAKMSQINFNPSLANKAMTNNCVRVYYEIAYNPYEQNGSDETTTLNWITAVHNNIATLYTNDEIQTAISEIVLWTTQDPYQGDFSENLYDFRDNRPTFNGDIAHLVNYPSTTSVAFLDSLCSDYNYAYSGIDIYFENVPTYSWTIGVMTHEMGHGLGSPHTHACVWNGDNTAIDGCGPTMGYYEGCEGPLPTNGGTIMSYCHLTSYVDLSQGFGPQPAALIRNTVDSKLCLGSDCGILAVDEIGNSNDLVVYPNPATTVLNIESKSEIQSLNLNDASGKIVVKSSKKGIKQQISMEHLPKGVYVLTVQTKEGTTTKKIIKK